MTRLGREVTQTHLSSEDGETHVHEKIGGEHRVERAEMVRDDDNRHANLQIRTSTAKHPVNNRCGNRLL